ALTRRVHGTERARSRRTRSHAWRERRLSTCMPIAPERSPRTLLGHEELLVRRQVRQTLAFLAGLPACTTNRPRASAIEPVQLRSDRTRQIRWTAPPLSYQVQVGHLNTRKSPAATNWARDRAKALRPLLAGGSVPTRAAVWG